MACSVASKPHWVGSVAFSLFALLTLGLLPASAVDRRVALVIGNSNYQQASALPNPRNDAEDMAATLKQVGFEVIQALDVDKRGMDNALARFNRSAKGASVALFYFAGHGMQYNGSNYILPIDAQLEDDVGLRYEAVSLDQVRSAVEEASGVKIMILDACRNNPLAAKLARSVAGTTRALPLTRGLARIEQTTGTVVAYATQANQVAEDGGGRNSPFTMALIENLREPGVEIASMFRRVANSVHERTNGRQVPELSISLLNDFYLNQSETDMQAWNRVRASSDVSGLREFIERFPSSMLADAARSRLDVVERTERDARERAQRDEQARIARVARERELREELAKIQREGEAQSSQMAALAPTSPAPGVTPAASDPRRVEIIAPVQAPPALQAPPAVQAPPSALTAALAPPVATTPPVTQSAAAPARLQVLPAPTPPEIKQTIAALPATTLPTPTLPPPAEVAARTLGNDDPKILGKFKTEMRRLGCYAAANDRDWNGGSVKQALSLFAKQANLSATPARLDEQQLDELQKRKARLCPSICNVRQAENSSGRCVAKTCGRGEMLDADGDCVDRPSTRRARAVEQPVARQNRSIERPAARAEPRPPRVRERVIEREVVERRPRRVVEEPIVTEVRRPCTPGPSFGIGFGPIRLATGGRC